MISFPNTLNQGGIDNELYDERGNKIYTNDSDLITFDTERLKAFNVNLNSSIKKSFMNDATLDISTNQYRTPTRTFLNESKTIYGVQDYATDSTEYDTAQNVFGENPFQTPAPILATMNRYSRVYKTPANNLLSAGNENTDYEGSVNSNGGSSGNSEANKTSNGNSEQTKAETTDKKSSNTAQGFEYVALATAVVSSIFNTTSMIQVNGLIDNLPLMNRKTDGDTIWASAGSTAYNGYGQQTQVEKPVTFKSWEIKLDKDGNIESPDKYKGKKYDRSNGWVYDVDKQGNVNVVKEKETGMSITDAFTNSAYINSAYVRTTNKDEYGNSVLELAINTNPFNTDNVENASNCTIRELVAASRQPNGELGMGRYRYADFLFCKNVGKVSNNHMITLRKFAHPVGDNIFRYSTKGYLNEGMPYYHGFQENSSIGTMITWFGTDDNKLEDIMNYSFNATWKEFKSHNKDIDSKEDNSDGGLIGMFANSFNPAYNSLVARGMAGSNSIWNPLGSRTFGGVVGKAYNMLGMGSAPGGGGINQNSYGQWDKMRWGADANRIYEPQNTIRSTHKYDGELVMQHEFTLNFSYRLRALDVMNPKTVMLDLIGNILEVTYRRGTFWGGSNRIIGPPRNSTGIAKANAFIDRQWDKLEGFMMGFANGTLEWRSILSSLSDMVSSAVEAIKGAAEDKGGWANLFVDTTKKLAGKFVSSGASKALLGQLKNQLGRPAVYVMDSLLSGDPVGLWHVTIGNPKNPIAAFGNMILTNTKITHSGPLGFDDFPTEIKVACTLKHGRPRDLTEIARMYTKGVNSFYTILDKNKLSNFFTVSNTTTGKKVEAELFNANAVRNAQENLSNIDSKMAALDEKEKSLKEELDKADKAEQQKAQSETAAATAETKKTTDSNNKTNDGKKNGKKDGETDKKENETDKKNTPTQGSTAQTNTQQSGTTGTEQTAQQPQGRSKEAIQKDIDEVTRQKKNLEKSKEASMNLLKSEEYQKYLKEDYSPQTDLLSDAMKASLKLNDKSSPKSRGRYDHFILTTSALRYETLGQDTDYEGRILIDERGTN